jgi:hypothetical protein
MANSVGLTGFEWFNLIPSGFTRNPVPNQSQQMLQRIYVSQLQASLREVAIGSGGGLSIFGPYASQLVGLGV